MTSLSPIGTFNAENDKTGFMHIHGIENDMCNHIEKAEIGPFVGLDFYTATHLKNFINNIPIKDIKTPRMFEFLTEILDLCLLAIEGED